MAWIHIFQIHLLFGLAATHTFKPIKCLGDASLCIGRPCLFVCTFGVYSVQYCVWLLTANRFYIEYMKNVGIVMLPSVLYIIADCSLWKRRASSLTPACTKVCLMCIKVLVLRQPEMPRYATEDDAPTYIKIAQLQQQQQQQLRQCHSYNLGTTLLWLVWSKPLALYPPKHNLYTISTFELDG